MPNIGRPSKGCKHCRERKVKCDQKRPTCSQCIRSGKECYGYRDALSMMFKDETAVVAKKAEKRYEALALQNPQTSSGSRERQLSDVGGSKGSPIIWTDTDTHSLRPYFPSASRYPTPESMTMEITSSVEDQAVGFFISNHVSQPTLIPRGQYEWVIEALNEPGCEEILRCSVHAASLAGLANSTKNSVIMAKAHAAYGSALRMTNNALRVKETAVKDTTLVSVIMLGMYENFVFHDNRSIQAWAKHMQGASAILNLRGKEQFESNTARRIFHQVYGLMMLVSLEAGQAVPDGMRELYDYCNPSSNYAIHGRQWTTRLTNFMHDAIDVNRDKESDPVTLVTRAISLDRELDSIKALIPKIWRYETIHLKQPSKYAYGTFYHVYTDSWIAQMWNNLRSCRMSLYRVIREQLWKGRACNPPLFSREEVEPQVAAAEKIIRTTIAAVCASVPQLTGMIIFLQWPAPTSGGPFAGSFPEVVNPDHARYQIHPPGTFLDPARPTGMHHLIWPLYAAGLSDLASNEMRQWVIQMLYFIALRIGTRQAVVLADSLKEMQKSAPLQSKTIEPILDFTFGT
ncbi:hypothetical protein BU25DRAFT_334528 [Macroventuria anomochaeta]|uniref:Uncharacterized protein n=1 Tax=Macroventuria anomochaeta TaxID=301207 RepID=A0ACB6S9S4_9PLEO|nr:uncharacterized protein BU25DRAFT_334528 [Macroventuria anomochaeta]KAF2630814.1 hypothetical protein BU25DRAFT_334528 [Macroventuria anomochaeta]